MEDIAKVKETFLNELSLCKNKESIENIKIKYLGRNGLINNLLKNLFKSPIHERKIVGSAINSLKNEIQNSINQQLQTFTINQLNNTEEDKYIIGSLIPIGSLHPTTLTIRMINSFFRYYGFSVYEGPEIETDEYNFEKLNIPKDHPARELQDTLYIHEPEILLRTHTSSVETRAMTNETLPIRIVVPGKAYRNETSNVTNNSVFYQYEGLLIDKNITMADLKGILYEFSYFLFGKDIKIRYRCKYYPQVEPGVGLDIGCTFCNTKGCAVCKYRGFIETLGAGMVHPNILQSCNINPSLWSGFAFGIGLDRIVMLKYGISDIRSLYSGQLKISYNTL